MARQPIPLDPDARSTLRALLLPPDGYELDRALATAYSLDMETLVTIPLFAAGLAAEEIVRPLGIARIYELGQRLTLLVQGDHINMRLRRQHSHAHSLIQLVADAVVPCSAGDGSFHPKLLVVKFKETEAHKDKKRHLYRVVVATRNLTVDNSWDSVLVLDQDQDGEVVPGLSDSIAGLAQFINKKDHPAVALCRRLGDELRNVPFQIPRGLRDLEMHLFTPGSNAAKDVQAQLQGDNLLVISPFVRQTFLEDLKKQIPGPSVNRWLVTRTVDVPKWAFDHYQVFQITEGAIPEPTAIEGGEHEVPEQLRGLHAKLYLASTKGGVTRIVITSANASHAGWNSNVEIAVSAEAKGKANQVSALLQPSDDEAEERNFRDLLEEFTFNAVTEEKKDPAWEKTARRVMAQATATGKVQKGPPRTLNVTMKFPRDVSLSLKSVDVQLYPLGFANLSGPMTIAPTRLTGRVEIPSGIELVPFIVLKLTESAHERPLEIVLAMQLSGDLDWGRENARRTLALGARQWLVDELLWHFGVQSRKKGRNGNDPDPGTNPDPGGKRISDHLMPILEKILLRVHGPRAAAEIETIETLLAGVEDHEEYKSLIQMWNTVKESLK